MSRVFSEELVNSVAKEMKVADLANATICLLYTSDAADE